MIALIIVNVLQLLRAVTPIPLSLEHLLYHLKFRGILYTSEFDNIFPEFAIRPAEPCYPWLSDQLHDSLSQHLNSLQDSLVEPPMFSDLIQDNPGYDLIPPGPLVSSYVVDPCGMGQDIDLTIYESDQDMDTTAPTTNLQGVDPTEQPICDDFMVGFINDHSVDLPDHSVDQPDQSVEQSEQAITPKFMGDFMVGFPNETTGEASLVSNLGDVEEPIQRRNISLDASIPEPAPEVPEENVPYTLFVQPKGSQRKKKDSFHDTLGYSYYAKFDSRRPHLEPAYICIYLLMFQNY